MKVYLDLLRDVVANGVTRSDRTGAGTRSVFGRQIRFDLNEGFPAITTKKLAFNAVKSELLWFLEGSGDERRLAEILHGTRDTNKTTIWTANANSDYWKPKAKFDGDCGRIYGQQWRKFPKPPENLWQQLKQVFTGLEYVDQLTLLIDGIKKDPYGRRHVLTAWNPGELDSMALPPCHMFAQFYVADGKLSCQLYQRSADMALGVPLNIASYALLTHMVAQVCNLEVGDFVHTFGDTHIYTDHFDGVSEQLTRTPHVLPTLKLNPDIKNITDFKMTDIELVDYQHHAAIKLKMSV